MSSSNERVALGDEVAIRLFALTREWRHVLGQRLAPHGLSEATWRVMLHLDLLHGSAVQTLLAASMGIEGPSLVRLIDRMERDGWVRRQADPQDRRVNLIEPTPKGRAVMQQVSKAAADMRAEVFAGLDTAEMARLSDLLLRMASQLHPLREGARPAERRRPAAPRRRTAPTAQEPPEILT